MRYLFALLTLLVGVSTQAARAADQTLIVVEDHGGVSALPYYQALDLRPMVTGDIRPSPQMTSPPPSTETYDETHMLPVRSELLTPGTVERRVIKAPALRPLFLVGDDSRSLDWLRRRASTLLELGAVGLVVNVESVAALKRLRGMAPNIMLSPASGDDLAHRLGIRHYPVLITATGIEQ